MYLATDVFVWVCVCIGIVCIAKLERLGSTVYWMVGVTYPVFVRPHTKRILDDSNKK